MGAIDWLASVVIAQATIINPINSQIVDSNPETIYINPVNIQLKVQPTKWNIWKAPSLRPSPKTEPPLDLKLIGFTLVGDRISRTFNVAVQMEITLKSHCYRQEITDTLNNDTIQITVAQKWHPLLFCNNRDSKTIEGFYIARSASVPDGSYSVTLNGQPIAQVQYKLEENQLTLNYDGKTFTITEINQKVGNESRQVFPTVDDNANTQ